MKRYISYFVATVFLFVSAAFASAACVQTSDGTGIQSFTLLAGQTIDSGTVSTQVVGDNLKVTYTASGGWTLNEVHLWVGGDIADMPQTRKGNPIPGKFPHVSGNIAPATTYTLNVSLADLGFACPGDDKTYLVGAHASMSKTNSDGSVQNETGWSDGAKISERGNWATLSTLTLTCDCGGGNTTGLGSCETAFAYSASPEGTSFLQIDEDGDGSGDFSRWGWSVGPLGAGSYEYAVYAGAGKSDITKGTNVGTLAVDYDGSTATVNFSINYPNNLKETHVYVGNEILPRNNGFFTVAPGQYPQIQEGLNGSQYSSYTFTDLSGEVYVVAHATVCGFPEKLD
jgi:hypothetical protein